MKETNELERISFKKIGQSILEVLNFERGIFYTIYALLTQSGDAIETYLKRDREKMMKPVRFSIVILAITTIVFLNYGGGEFISGVLEGSMDATDNKNEEHAKRLIGIFEKYCNLFLVFLVPITAFFSWIMFKKSAYNGAEHLVISAYVFSFQSLIFVVLALVFSLFLEDDNDVGLIIQFSLIFLLSTFFQLFVYFKIFKQGAFKTIFKGVVIIFFSFFVYFILFMLLLVLGGVL